MNSEYSRQKELKNCSFVKMVLMILVVLGHSANFWTESWFTKNPVFKCTVLDIMVDYLNSFHTYGFVLVSGYIFYYIKYERGSYRDLKEFVINKIKRLIIPYITVSICWVIPISLYFFDYSVKEYVINYFFAVSPSQLWFLWMLFMVFILAYFFAKTFQKHNILSICIGFIFWGLGCVLSIPLKNYFQIWSACKYLIFFLIGFKLRQNDNICLIKLSSVFWFVTHLTLFILLQFLLLQDMWYIKILNIGVGFALNIIGAVGVFAILQKLALRVNNDSKGIRGLIKYSMPIFLFHQQIIYFIIYWLNGRINPYLHFGINFIGGMLGSLLMAFIFINTKWLRVLIGEK